MAKKRMYLNGKIVEVDEEQLKNRTYNDLSKVYPSTEEEIAPVKTTKKNNKEKKWYETIIEKPKAFDDGYNVGEITGTVLGSTVDAGLNALEGIFRVGEGIAMTGAGLIVEGIDAFNGGESEYTKGVRRRISGEDGSPPMTRLTQWLEDQISDYSIFGQTGDEVFSGIGYTYGMFEGGKALPGGGNVELAVGGHVARLPVLSAVGGASSGFQEAYQKGATGTQAISKALGSGAIESITESMFGFMGIGGNDITDEFAKKFTSQFSSGVAQNLAKIGVSSTAEGLEEVISSAGNQFLDKMIDRYSGENDPKFYEKLNPDELAQEFVTTFLSTAITGGYDSVTNVNHLSNNAIDNFEKEIGRPLTVQEKTSIRDQVARAFANENTLNEQRVIDNEMNSRLAELGNYTRADRTRIRNEINQDLENGRISVDSINNTLPGITDQWDAQFNELRELQEEIKNSDGAEKDYLIGQYQQKLQEYKQDDRLRNSYVEEVNKGRTFNYNAEGMSDLSKETYESAVESGMNNTKDTHDLVDFASKMAEYTGVNIKFATNDYLKTIPDIANKMTEKTVVNGANIESENTIYINKDSSKNMYTIIGHELGHLLDKTNEGQKIRDFARKYADSIGEYNDRYTRLSKNYNENEISTEMANDIIGEYLFTDEDFVSKLATDHPGTFQKIYDWFQHIFKLAKSGSKEARQLEQVRYNLEKGLAKVKNNVESIGENRYTKGNRSDVDGSTRNDRRTSRSMEDISTKEVRENGSENKGKKTTEKYRKFEEYIEQNRTKQLSKEQEKLKNKALNDYNKSIVFYDGNGEYYGGASTKDSNVIYIPSNKSIETQEFILGHEVAESQIMHSEGLKNNYINDLINEIIEDKNWQQARKNFIGEQKELENLPDYYIAKDILCDYYSESKSHIDIDYETNFEQQTMDSIQYAIELIDKSIEKGTNSSSFSLTEQLEKNLEKTLFNAENERQGMIDLFNSYLEENDITNPTLEDINNSLDTYDLMDANGEGENLDQIRNKYIKTIKEYLNEQGISLGEELAPMISKKKDGTLQIRQKDIRATDEDLENIFGKQINEEYDEAMEDAEKVKFSISEDGELIDNKGKKVKLEASEVGNTKTLMAIHNLSEEKMKGILELGGFPVPSIAITNPNTVNHDGYGKISVLFDKKTIDPSNKKNEVYDRDVWSPRFPTVDYNLNSKTLEKIGKELGIRNYDLEAYAEENKKPEWLAERLTRVEEVVDKYVKDNNLKYDVVYKENSKEIDEYDTNKNKKEVAIENGINDYLLEKIQPLFEEKGIYNGKEYITENGRRTFWQTHDKYNLENVVKNIIKQDTVSSETSIFGAGFGNIQANLSNQYKSLDEIKANESKIMTNEEAKKVVEPLVNELNDEMVELSHLYGEKFDPFWDMDSINYHLQELSKEKNINADAFYEIAHKYNETLANADIDLVNRIVDTLNKVRTIPTDYFEAKPQRAVGFDEVQAVVIPNNLDDDFKKQLTDNGLKCYEYDPGVEGDRAKVINTFDDIKFSLSEKDEEIAPVKQTYPKSYEPFYEFAKEKGFLDEDEKMLIFNGSGKEKTNIKEKVSIPKDEKNQVIIPEKSQGKKTLDLLNYLFVNRNSEIDNLAKDSGNMNIKYLGDMLNGVSGEAQNETIYGQTNNQGERIGKSINELFEWANQKGLSDAYNDYLLHYSNIDRHKMGKGSNVEQEVSEKMVKKYEKAFPEFKTHGKDVWNFSKNVRDNLLEAGLINQSYYDYLSEAYPHYVPYMEERDISQYIDNSEKLKPVRAIKSAKGGATHTALTPVQEALTKYVYSEKKSIRQNDLYREIFNTIEGEKTMVGADIRTNPVETGTSLYSDENGNFMQVYFDGELNSMRISDELYKQLNRNMEKQIRDLEQNLSLITKPLQTISNVRRNLLTTWSPSFIVKNPIKDFGDALINSKDTKGFIKNYLPAYGELMSDTELAQQFKALYGSGNAMGEYENESGLSTGKKAIQKGKGIMQKIANFNEIVELAPRFAEFKATLERGGSVQEAMYNAREVTINFNRGGVITKAMNRNGFTFLNASVQGFDKFIRNFSGQNGAIGVVGALMKATTFGVLPALFNHLVYAGGDEPDEDYEALPDYIKDNYYLIKTDNGTFIRIPKGRIPAVFGMVARRTLEYAQGEEDAYEGMVKSVYDQVGFDPFNNNVFAPIQQAYFSGENGEAWYGGDLVPTRLQDKPKGEQYDESTDAISKWVGSKFGISPYKLNYVLDQYSGGMGDIFLPMITEEASSDAETLPEYAIAPIKDQFIIDSTMDNKYAGEFYQTKEDFTIKSNSQYATDEDTLKSKYLNSVSSELSKLYQEKREIQSDPTLSKKQKYEKVKLIQDEINKLAKEGLEGYEQLNKTDNYAIIGDREFYKDGDEWKKVSDKELEALNSLGLDINEKTSYINSKDLISGIKEDYEDVLETATDDEKTILNRQKKLEIIDVVKKSNLTDEAKAYLYTKNYGDRTTVNALNSLGISMNDYLDLESQEFTSDKYANGKTVPNSKKNKTLRYINSMSLTKEQKIILAKLKYPSIKSYNPQIINYIQNNRYLDYDEKKLLLDKLGFKVENNRISW